MMLIQPVTSENDIVAVAGLARDIWTEYWPAIIGADQTAYMINAFQSEHAIKKQMADGACYFLAGDETTWYGYFSIVQDTDRMMISKFYIRSDLRGQGIGKAMLKAIRSLATERGCSVLWLVVNRRNQLAISVYEALGFKQTATRVKDIGNGFIMDDFVYEQALI